MTAMQERPNAFGWMTNNGALLLVLTTLFWGGNAVAGKLAVGHVSPLVLSAARWVLASLVLGFIAYRHLYRDMAVIRANIVYLFLLGSVGYAFFTAFLYTALKFTTALNVTILQAGMPMVIFALNFILFRVPTRWAQALGYSITLAGVLVTAARGEWNQLAALSFNQGDVIMFGAILIYAGYSVALAKKPVMHWLSFLTVLAFSAALTAIPMAAFEIVTDTAIWPTTPRGLALVFYATVFPSILAQAFFIRGNELLGGNAAGLFLNLVPIFGALLSVMILGENFHLYHAVALGMVIGGILIAQRLGNSGSGKRA
jgi:drug/metabolite transporter (DMT)-like permease